MLMSMLPRDRTLPGPWRRRAALDSSATSGRAFSGGLYFRSNPYHARVRCVTPSVAQGIDWSIAMSSGPPAPDRHLKYQRSRFLARLPLDRLYVPSHYWIQSEGPDLWRVGFTRFAKRMLGEIVEC